MQFNQYAKVCASSAGSVHVSPDRATLVLRLSTLSRARPLADLLRSAMAHAENLGARTLVTDMQHADGASFDALWKIEEWLCSLRDMPAIEEWRHVHSASVVLHTALRRLVRQAQSQGLFCGVYLSLADAVSAFRGCHIDGQTGLVSSPVGVVARCPQYLLAELHGECPDMLLDVHMDALSYAMQDIASSPRVIVRLRQDARVALPPLLRALQRLLDLGGGPVVAIVDEAGILDPAKLSDDNGIYHVVDSMAQARAWLSLISMKWCLQPRATA